MTITATTNLSLPIITTGTESGTWGDDVNNGLTQYLDIAIAGGLAVTITTNDVTLTNTAGTSSATNISSTSAQYAILNISGAKTAARNLIVPSSSKYYLINNAGTGGFLLTVKGAATSGVTLIDGEKAIVAWNGTDYVKISGQSGSGTFYTVTATAPTAASSNLGAFNYGTLSFSDTGIVQSAQTSVNSYFQNVIQNTSAGTAASAEFIAYNDQGTASTNYATVGINSSGYTGTGSINAAGYAYFLSASTDLVLGTIGANGIHFTTNSSATDALAISSAGAVSLPGGTANGVAYLNGSKVVTTGSTLTFNGSALGVSATGSVDQLALFAGQNANNYIAIYDGSGTNATFGSQGGGNAYMFSGTGKYTSFYANASEQMRLTSTGLGIGTSSPSDKLTVVSASQFSGVTIQGGTTNGASILTLKNSNSAGIWQLGVYGSGLTPPNNFYIYDSVNSAVRATIDTSGNLGLGVTPSAWYSTARAYQFSTSGSVWGLSGQQNVFFSNNEYLNASAVATYIATGYASRFQQQDGAFKWSTAPSGTAGNAITFTQAMTLDASGNLGVGTTTPSTYGLITAQTYAGTSAIPFFGLGNAAALSSIVLRNLYTRASGVLNGMEFRDSSNEVQAGMWANATGSNNQSSLVFGTNNGTGGNGLGNLTERARITSDGNLLVGTTSTSAPNPGFLVLPNYSTIGGIAKIGHSNGAASGTTFLEFLYNGGYIGGVTQNGTTGVLYNLTSDYRLKNDQQPLTGAKEFVMALQPKKWQWWDGSGEGVGFVAHEFMEVAKYSGQGEKDAVDADGKPLYQSIQPSSSEVMANLVAHIQELETRLAALEAK